MSENTVSVETAVAVAEAPVTQTNTVKPEIENFGRLDIRVGKVLSVKEHPDADSLYIEEIDVGEGAPRTIVSGLRKFISIEQFTGKFTLVLCNLPPRKMRGVMSNGMVLCASNVNAFGSRSDTVDHSVVELLEPDNMNAAVPGERVTIFGCEKSVVDEILKPKQKVWEKCEPHLKSRSDVSVTPVASFGDFQPLFGLQSKVMFLPNTLKEYTIG